MLVASVAGAGLTGLAPGGVAGGIAATAVRNGHKALLVTTASDAAAPPNRDDPAGHEPRELATGLYGLRLDPVGCANQVWPVLGGQVRAVLDDFGLEPPQIEDVLLLDAANRLFSLLQLRQVLDENRWDVVVVDLGAAKAALALLGLPELIAFQLDRLLPTGRRVERAVRAGGEGVVDPLLAGLPHLGAELRSLREMLAPATAYVCLPAESTAVPEAISAMAGLSLLGHRVAGAVLTGLVPAEPGEWLRRTARAQAQIVSDLRRRLAGTDTEVLPTRHPGGAPLPDEMMSAVAADLTAMGHDPVRTPVSSGVRVVTVGDEFELRLPLPFSERGDVRAMRQEDDLIVDVGGHRRMIRLASALRRCTVAGARLRDGVLTLRFVRDPRLWRE